MRVLKKIGFSEDLFLLIDESAKLHNNNLTKEVNRLLKKGLGSDDISMELFNIKKDVREIKKISLYIYDILKQIYANMEIEAVDMKSSRCLNNYLKDRKKDKFND